MTAKPPVIIVENVTKKFGKFNAVDAINFAVKTGEIVGFVGVNGAGKTTTINMLLGFTSPTEGSLSLFGEQVKLPSSHRSHRHIGYAAGDMELPARMTGRQYIQFVASQYEGDHTKHLTYLTKIFSPQLDKKISTLSRGNKQKIALVAAFLTKPSLVVLDEPTSGLDPIMQDVFLQLVREERDRGTTIFMSSHYLQEVAEVCTRVLLMKNGKIVEDLSSEQLQETSGKTVRLISATKAEPPHRGVSVVEHSKSDGGYQLSFVYKGKIADLQSWIVRQTDVIDIDISERTLEAEFRALYQNDGAAK